MPGTQSITEDTVLPIAGVSVADVDGDALTTTLSVANGILNVTAGTGVNSNWARPSSSSPAPRRRSTRR